MGFGILTSIPVVGWRSTSGCAISSGCSSGSSGLSTSSIKVSISLSGITISANLTDLSSFNPLSPSEMRATIKTNRNKVVVTDRTKTAKYLLISNSLM